MHLEDLAPNGAMRGILPDSLVPVVNVQWFGSDALELTYKTLTGKVANELLYQHDEARIEIVELGRLRRFDSDGELFRLVSEAQRINLAHLFDPVLAVHTSLFDPLPHQITSVYETMLPRQPLRFLLADDPGAGKTIMAGLLIKELIARGDHACLVECTYGIAYFDHNRIGKLFGIHSLDIREGVFDDGCFECQLTAAKDGAICMQGNRDLDVHVVQHGKHSSGTQDGTDGIAGGFDGWDDVVAEMNTVSAGDLQALRLTLEI
jgi:hypothetical protein